jgi:hypothetical protein
MLILRFFCENSPRIIAASGAVLKTGSQALVCQFLPNLYTSIFKLSNTPLIYTSVILHPVDGALIEYLNTCVTIFGNNQKRNTHFATR